MIFSQFTIDDIVVGRINQVSSGLFGTGSLYVTQSRFTTSSTQANNLTGSSPFDVKNGQYYLNVLLDGETYFAIAYGDYENSGSSKFDGTSSANPTKVFTNESKVIYSQYKNTLLQPGDQLFSFASGSVTTPVDSENIFVMNFSSDKIKDQLDPGQIQINLSGSNGSFSYIDDSQVINKQQNVYNLISGSVISGVATPYYNNGSPVYAGIGLFYPSNGVVIFNATKVNNQVGFTHGTYINSRLSNDSTYVTANSVQNAYRLWQRDFFNAIKLSNKAMAARKSEFVPSTNYFVRVKNKEFNYSNNPTFVSDGTDGLTKGTIIYQDLINNPRTYITSVGLYNSNNELLAIGKISRPVQKSFDSELLIKVRIDF
tara:strand:+ start:2286 stop:3398 length:1113 start_codon:yes stop_codon:yes gene_type:complete